MNCESFAAFKAARFKICSSCGSEQHISKFNWHSKGRPANICYDCFAERQRLSHAGRINKTSRFYPYIDEIRRMRSEGYLAAEILEELGLEGEGALYCFCSNHGIRLCHPRVRAPHLKVLSGPNRTVDDETLDRVRLLLLKDLTRGQIAQKLGVTRNVVAGWVFRYGLLGMTERPPRFISVR